MKIILTIAAIVTAILFGLKPKNEDYGYEIDNLKFEFNAKHIISLVLFIGALATNFFVIIPANTVGIKYSLFGGTKTETLSEGFGTKGFFDKIYKIKTEVQTKELKDLSGQTLDSQFIIMDLNVKYKVNPEKAYEVFKQFKTLDKVDEQLIAPITQRAIESVTTQYNIIEALGEKRNEMTKEIEKQLTESFAKAGIEFYSVTFVDTDAGTEIEEAIRAEAVAKKAVETAEQERLKAEIEAQKRVVEAQADLDKAKIEAETKVVEAQAEAEANKVISESITQSLIDKILAEARLKHGWVEVVGADTTVIAK